MSHVETTTDDVFRVTDERGQLAKSDRARRDLPHDVPIQSDLASEEPVDGSIDRSHQRTRKRNHPEDEHHLDHPRSDFEMIHKELIESPDSVRVHRDEQNREHGVCEASLHRYVYKLVSVDVVDDKKDREQRRQYKRYPARLVRTRTQDGYDHELKYAVEDEQNREPVEK